MEWYEIVISAVATLGGVGGLISLYKAKPERTSIEVQNMKEMLGEAHKMFDAMKAEKEAEHKEFEEYKAKNMEYIEQFKARFAKLEERLDNAENVVFRLKGAIYQAYRCRFAPQTDDCPVLQALEKNGCEECFAIDSDDKKND
jgi:predicted RNase H-like nuclease (RuvC/YqgF family)